LADNEDAYVPVLDGLVRAGRNEHLEVLAAAEDDPALRGELLVGQLTWY
jgi:hypothetical protein